MSADRNDKMAAEADWRDGMNAFRLKVYENLEKLNEELQELKQIIKGEPQ